MNRRKFITLLGGAAAACPMGAWAQQSKVPVIGWLGSTSPQQSFVTPFLEGLKSEGFVENNNVVIRYRWAAGSYERLPAFVAEFVGSRVDLIAAFTTVSAVAAKTAPASIPTVFLVGGDPVQLGLVSSMNRPGGNRTGMSLITHSLDAKRLELLRELVPAMTRIGVMLNPKSSTAEANRQDVQAAAQSLGLQTVVVEVSGQDDLTSAFAKLLANRADALLVGAEQPAAQSQPTYCATGYATSSACRLRMAGARANRWAVELRDRFVSGRQTDGWVRRPHFEGNQACRPARS
jgi:putative ABC transport system substrate-binding protein